MSYVAPRGIGGAVIFSLAPNEKSAALGFKMPAFGTTTREFFPLNVYPSPSPLMWRLVPLWRWPEVSWATAGALRSFSGQCPRKVRAAPEAGGATSERDAAAATITTAGRTGMTTPVLTSSPHRGPQPGRADSRESRRSPET